MTRARTATGHDGLAQDSPGQVNSLTPNVLHSIAKTPFPMLCGRRGRRIDVPLLVPGSYQSSQTFMHPRVGTVRKRPHDPGSTPGRQGWAKGWKPNT